MEKNLPPATVERLSNYRRKLKGINTEETAYIHSHQLAHLMRINPAHIRRDLMLINFSGDIHKGYNIENLIAKIGENIDCIRKQKLAFIGIGDLGRALASEFKNKDSKLEIVAAFRLEENLNDESVDFKCYPISKIKQVLKKEEIDIIVLTLTKINLKEVLKNIVDSGVKGILNFTSAHLDVPDEIYVENYDMIGKLEKLSYFTSCKD
ncbi:MAG: redox-sensing transcriptional repressor Rex [Marinilabiliales bacterium]|nr:MAG: redox-sensing transcriptional repressor Rex [Marinilabiliales bacterium]